MPFTDFVTQKFTGLLATSGSFLDCEKEEWDKHFRVVVISSLVHFVRLATTLPKDDESASARQPRSCWQRERAWLLVTLPNIHRF